MAGDKLQQQQQQEQQQQRHHRVRTRVLILFFASIVFVSSVVFLNDNVHRSLNSFALPFRPTPDRPDKPDELDEPGKQRRPNKTDRPDRPDDPDADHEKAIASTETTMTTKHGHSGGAYPQVSTLPAFRLPLNDPTRRLIIIGDVHGHLEALETLLRKVEFSASRGDTVIFTGDLVNKGPDSAGVVALAMEIGAFAARGNHDDRVARACEDLGSERWGQSQGRRTGRDVHTEIDQVEEEKDGEKTLTRSRGTIYRTPKTKVEDPGKEGAGSQGSSTESGSEDGNETAASDVPFRLYERGETEKERKLEAKSRKSHARDLETAKSLTPAQRDWLSALPLILRIGNLGPRYGEVVVVHAGLVPRIPLKSQDPEAVMNMRTLLRKPKKEGKHHKGKSAMIPSASRDGIPWAEVWNSAQTSMIPARGAPATTVVYGHDSKSGLQIHEYTLGLDSGCGRSDMLTGLVFEVDPASPHAQGDDEGEPNQASDGDDDDYEREEENQHINATGRRRKNRLRHRLVSVSCADAARSK